MRGEQWTLSARAAHDRRVSRAMRDKDARGLTAAERAIELLRTHSDMSIVAIGEEVGISWQRVSQLAKKVGISRAALRSERKATRLERIAAAARAAAQESAERREERKRASLEALRAFYAKHGRSPKMVELGTITTARVRSLPHATTLVRYFGSTSRAFELAGIPRRLRGRPRRVLGHVA